MILMATKSHKNPMAYQTCKAPIGARNFLACLPNDFCDFSRQKLPGILTEGIGGVIHV